MTEAKARWKKLATNAQMVVMVKLSLIRSVTSIGKSDQDEKQGCHLALRCSMLGDSSENNLRMENSFQVELALPGTESP